MSLPRDPRLLLSLSDSDVDGVAVTQSPGAYLRIAWRDGGAEKRAATSGLDTPSTAAVRVELELSPSVLRPDVFMTLAFSAVERRSAFSCRRLRPSAHARAGESLACHVSRGRESSAVVGFADRFGSACSRESTVRAWQP